MTLHDAIITVLLEFHGSIEPQELVRIINERRLYIKKDKSPVSINQIYARINNYSNLFALINGKIP